MSDYARTAKPEQGYPSREQDPEKPLSAPALASNQERLDHGRPANLEVIGWWPGACYNRVNDRYLSTAPGFRTWMGAV